MSKKSRNKRSVFRKKTKEEKYRDGHAFAMNLLSRQDEMEVEMMIQSTREVLRRQQLDELKEDFNNKIEKIQTGESKFPEKVREANEILNNLKTFNENKS